MSSAAVAASGLAADAGVLPEAYPLVDTWRGLGRATRIVYAQNRQLVILRPGQSVLRYRPDGTPVAELPGGQLIDVNLAADGNAYGATQTSLRRLQPDGSPAWTYTFQVRFSPSRPLIVDAWVHTVDIDALTGRVVALVETDQLRLASFTPAGNLVSEWQPPRVGDLYTDLDIDADGNLYLLNRSTPAVEVYARDGEPLRSVAAEGRPRRLAAGPGGSVFVLTDTGWVWKYDASGVARAAWDTADADPAVRSLPSDLTVDDDGRVYVVDSASGHVRIYAFEVSATVPETPHSDPYACQLLPDKSAAPSTVWLGQQVTVTLTLGGDCPSYGRPSDIMLVVDRSGSMAGSKIVEARLAAEAFVNAIDFSSDRVGLVSFESSATLDARLTTDRASVVSAIRRLTANGGTDMVAALDLAAQELDATRRPQVNAIIVMLTDGVPFNTTQAAALEAADRAKLSGTIIYAIGLGVDVNPALLRPMAATREHYFYAPTESELRSVYEAIARRIQADVLMRDVIITDVVPENFLYVNGSAWPSQPEVNGQVLTWQIAPVTFSGLRITYRLQPLEAGLHPTNREASYNGTDGLDRHHNEPFPVPKVLVLEPATSTPTSSPTPSATATPTATPTDTASPTASPTATATASPSQTASPTSTLAPSLTPTPRIRTIYMPVGLAERCTNVRQAADVVLVIDTSTSMLLTTADGRVKLDAAKEAAKRFVDLLSLPADQAGVVWFNERVGVEQSLTGERQALHAAIDRIPVHEFTRIDQGITLAHHELLHSPMANPAAQRVMVVLTDGIPNPVPEWQVEAAADNAKSSGIRMFTVGLGQDVRPEFLRRLASTPDDYFESPTAGKLTDIYKRIAERIVCVPNHKVRQSAAGLAPATARTADSERVRARR
jgi:Mg-chelatase subunit ChlD